MVDCKVYVGDIKDATEKDLDRAFSSYGRLKSVWVARNPAGFAFVEFEDPRDAEDAVRGMDGKKIGSSRVRVEAATGKTKTKPWMRGGDRDRDRDRDRGRDRDYRGGSDRGGSDRGGPPSRGRRPFNPDDKCYECGRRGHYAYDCPQYIGRRGGSGGGDNYRSSRTSRYSRSRSRSPVRRSYSRSRSRSRSPRRSSRRTRSKSHSRSRSRSPEPRRRSASETGADRSPE